MNSNFNILYYTNSHFNRVARILISIALHEISYQSRSLHFYKIYAIILPNGITFIQQSSLSVVTSETFIDKVQTIPTLNNRVIVCYHSINLTSNLVRNPCFSTEGRWRVCSLFDFRSSNTKRWTRRQLAVQGSPKADPRLQVLVFWPRGIQRSFMLHFHLLVPRLHTQFKVKMAWRPCRCTRRL
jgi:hypothetical protein